MAVGDMNSGTSLTDSTLSEAGLPADSAATGEALAGKLDLHGTADNGVVASGAGYVRFGDGTQICWGQTIPAPNITSTEKYVSFPIPFAENAKVLTCSNANMGGVPVQVGWERSTGFTIGGGWNGIEASGGSTSWFAIGRWK